jgi:hypothetical protein
VRDYVAWHDAYAVPGSPLRRRLEVVVRSIGDVLDRAAPGPCRFVSLCAGQGDDVLTVAGTHPRGADLVGRLLELDRVNAAAATARVTELGRDDLEVVTADAGSTDPCAGAVPADLVVACGIFGNISTDDIERTVRAFPSLCAPGARVVRTRHPREPGVLEAIEGWFDEAGFEREAMVVDEDQHWAVGLHHLVADPTPFVPGRKLFTFVR